MMKGFLSRQLLVALCLFAMHSRFILAQEEVSVQSRSGSDHDTLGNTAQEQGGTASQVTDSSPPKTPALQNTQPKDSAKASGKHGSFVVAPIPISSPALGSGVVPVGAYIFPISKNDEVSPPSVIGAAALFTNNGSRAFAIAGQLYFARDTYKATAVYGRGNLNYDLYGSGISAGLKLPIKQAGQVFQGEFLRRIGFQFFLGPRFTTGTSLITARPTSRETPPPPPDLGISTNLTAIGIRLTRDTSQNRFYPLEGSFFEFTADFLSQTLGSKYSFQSYRTSVSKYWGWGEKQVLAYNGYACATGGKPPFYGNCIYGANSELRGYIAGEYFDRYMLTTQLEYRLALPLRLGVVGFGGIGEAIPGGDQNLFKNNSFLPAGGTGLRFVLSREYHVNLRSDFAWGKDGHTFSLGIGEAF
jgi:hypothetical protein